MFMMHGTHKISAGRPRGRRWGRRGLLIVIGLFTGIAAFICSGECFVFLFIAANGAGIWSLDNILRKRSTITASTGARRV